MKFTTVLSLMACAIPAAQAFVIPPTSREIQDENILSDLQARHASALESLRNHTAGVQDAVGESGIEKRAIFGLGGFVIIEVAGALGGTIAGLQNKLLKLFTDNNQEQIWVNYGYCRAHFMTQGGGNCDTSTSKRNSEGVTAEHKTGSQCSWNDPANTDPLVIYLEDDGIGRYSIQWTATSEHAWDGIDGTETCPAEGLCNPSLVFYREGYEMILNTWQSQGRVSACQYSGGNECLGLCSSGVRDQFTSGGVKWGGDCAIPCLEDTTLPDA